MSALNQHLKAKAASAVGVARKSGALPRPDACEACGATNSAEGRTLIAWHHHDYAKPLDVIPLCGSCHSRVHLGSLAEPRTGRMYPKRRRGNRGPSWPRADEDVLIKHWGELSTKEIAEKLGRTESAVRGRARGLGLSVSRRDEVVREALELRARMAPHEGPPPTDRVVLVREVGCDDVAFCVPSSLGWHLRWRKRHADCYDTTDEAEANGQVVAPGWLPPNRWPSACYRWHELPGGF